MSRFSKNNSWSTPIDKLMINQAENWSQIVTKVNNNLYLRVTYGQLFITEDEKIIETLSGKSKGVVKNDILLIVNYNKEKGIRKIKFQLKSTDLPQCLKKLGLHFPVIDFNEHTKRKPKPQYRTLEEAIQRSINISGDMGSLEMPPNFENFVKLCLLDPSFPQVVACTQNIIEQYSAN